MAAFSYQFHHNTLQQSSQSFQLETTSFKFNHNKHSKTHPESSSVTDKLDSGEQVTQHVPPLDSSSKRKSKEGHSPNGRKRRKWSKTMNDGEEKKAKEERKKQKKVDQDEAPKGYIHVRARRGQATDSHSLAERVRREKISERMKVLQELVPGCDKVTGKALMLDEIINYVQSLQNQVEFLSMKLASLNPLFYDYGVDLDYLMVRPDQILSGNMASPAQQNLHRTDQAIISDTAQLYSPASLFFAQARHHNNNNNLTQGSGQVLWDVDEQRQKQVINNEQTGFTSNLGSFH